MRVIIIFLCVLFLIQAAFAQQGKPDEPRQETRLEYPITKSQLLSLPVRGKSPKISLVRAHKIAEKFINTEKINVASCYLFQARWAADDFGIEPIWHFWWVCKDSDQDFMITVSGKGISKLSK